MTKYMVYGPIRDGEFVCWQIVGPKGGLRGTFYTKTEAKAYVKKLQSPRKRKGWTAAQARNWALDHIS